MEANASEDSCTCEASKITNLIKNVYTLGVTLTLTHLQVHSQYVAGRHLMW